MKDKTQHSRRSAERYRQRCGQADGLQFGLVNYAETAKNGVQIGLVNIIPQNEWFTELPNALAPGMVFVNWRF